MKEKTILSLLSFIAIFLSLFWWVIGFPAVMITLVAPSLNLFGRVFLTMPIGLFLWLLLGLMLWCLETALIIEGLKRIGVINSN